MLAPGGDKIQVSGEKRRTTLAVIRHVDFQTRAEFAGLEAFEYVLVGAFTQPGARDEHLLGAIRTDEVGVLVGVDFVEKAVEVALKLQELLGVDGQPQLLPRAELHPAHPGGVSGGEHPLQFTRRHDAAG